MKSLTASNGHIQQQQTSQVQSLLCNPPQISNQLLSQSHPWRRTNAIYNFWEESLCAKVISGRGWQLFEYSQLCWGQRSINQLLTESIKIVPLNAPNIVNDKLRPAHFFEVVRCILAGRRESRWEGMKHLTVWVWKETRGCWCEHRSVAWVKAQVCHLWAEDENCTMGWCETNQAADSKDMQKLNLSLRFKRSSWPQKQQLRIHLVGVCPDVLKRNSIFSPNT